MTFYLAIRYYIQQEARVVAEADVVVTMQAVAHIACVEVSIQHNLLPGLHADDERRGGSLKRVHPTVQTCPNIPHHL